jgi:hypothetical protein
MRFCKYGLIYSAVVDKTIISNTFFGEIKAENCNIIACLYGTGQGGAAASRRVATELNVDGTSHILYMQCGMLPYEERNGYIRVWNSQKYNNSVRVLHVPVCMLCQGEGNPIYRIARKKRRVGCGFNCIGVQARICAVNER